MHTYIQSYIKNNQGFSMVSPINSFFVILILPNKEVNSL